MAVTESPRPLRIHFCHGLESGPGGFKVRAMRGWGCEVVAPDMQMSLWNPLAANGVVRQLPWQIFSRSPFRWLAAAIDASLAACIEVQRVALREAETAGQAADVLVGSSWGGAVALCLLADGTWQGPAVILCPALLRLGHWGHGSLEEGNPRSAAAVIAALAALPTDAKARVLLVHGTADTVVPIGDSQELARSTGIGLREIEGGSHGLGTIATDGCLRRFVEEICGLSAWL